MNDLVHIDVPGRDIGWIVLLAVVSAGRDDEVFREGMETGKRLAEEMRKIDALEDEVEDERTDYGHNA